MPLARVTDYAKLFVQEVLREGDGALDGTVGNGHDTLSLAQHVGATGHVLGFDVQARALQIAGQQVEQAGLLDRVTLLQAGHERLAEFVKLLGGRPLRAAMFNLGYLPGGDKTLVTRPDTTLVALKAALAHLAPGGRLTVVLYPGHDGGAEATMVLGWAAALPLNEAQVLHLQFLNPRSPPPSLLVIERR